MKMKGGWGNCIFMYMYIHVYCIWRYIHKEVTNPMFLEGIHRRRKKQAKVTENDYKSVAWSYGIKLRML